MYYLVLLALAWPYEDIFNKLPLKLNFFRIDILIQEHQFSVKYWLFIRTKHSLKK